MRKLGADDRSAWARTRGRRAPHAAIARATRRRLYRGGRRLGFVGTCPSCRRCGQRRRAHHRRIDEIAHDLGKAVPGGGVINGLADMALLPRPLSGQRRPHRARRSRRRAEALGATEQHAGQQVERLPPESAARQMNLFASVRAAAPGYLSRTTLAVIRLASSDTRKDTTRATSSG